MKIVYIYPKLTFASGTERILIDKMNCFANQDDYEVMALTYEQDNHPIIFPLSSKVIHVDLDARFYELYKYSRFIRLIKWRSYKRQLQKRFDDLMASFLPDIVIATTYYVDIISMIKSCPTPFIKLLESHIDQRFIHNNDKQKKLNIYQRLHAWLEFRAVLRMSSKFDKLVALNSDDAADWSRQLSTIVIENIVHLNPLGRISSQNTKRVIFVGRYVWQKGVMDLLSIWAKVHSVFPDWHLDMYGDGILFYDLVKKADKLQANIHVHAPTTDIFEKYVDSTILLMTSNYEPFGLVMPEAMSCGLPVVAFDCPSGPANIISDGVDGYLINNRDINAFADKVCYLIEHQDARLKMGSAAVQSSLRYAPASVIPKWKELFLSLSSEKYKQNWS